MRIALIVLFAAPLALAVGPVLAQSTPSTDQLIQALKPTGKLSDTSRGIRVVSPSGKTVAPAAEAAQPAVDLTVEFATGSAELSPQAREALDHLGSALTSQDLAQFRFRIEGHTDTVGSRDANQALSQRRAEAVAAFLEQKFGIAPARLQAVGLGERDLAVPTPPQTANARNRRVKVVNLGA